MNYCIKLIYILNKIIFLLNINCFAFFSVDSKLRYSNMTANVLIFVLVLSLIQTNCNAYSFGFNASMQIRNFSNPKINLKMFLNFNLDNFKPGECPKCLTQYSDNICDNGCRDDFSCPGDFICVF